MKKQQSIFKLIGKLARILVGIVQRGEKFTPEKTVLNLDRSSLRLIRYITYIDSFAGFHKESTEDRVRSHKG